MTSGETFTYRAVLDVYEQQAEALFRALQSGDNDALWRVKWEHPRFQEKSIEDVRGATLSLSDAKTVVARMHALEAWEDVATFVESVSRDGEVARFEAAVEAVIAGDVDTLRTMIAQTPGLIRARSTRLHHATLLHYLGANGVEGYRQKTPANAVEVAKVLLDAGAAVDALADLYGSKCTTMSMLVSSTPPAEAGLQAALAETLLDYGAAFEGGGTNWQSAVLTALIFGFPATANALVRRGAPLQDLRVVAGLGRAGDVARLLPRADSQSRHAALALAAQSGHAEVVRILLDAGEDPDRNNPEGYHAHATPLHHAALADHEDVVRLLVERGARLDIRDTIYSGTPLDWAVYGGKTAIAEYLREHGARGA